MIRRWRISIRWALSWRKTAKIGIRANDYARAHKRFDGDILHPGQRRRYGAVYIYSMCLMMEMQWLKSQAIHSGEYFHGPFEMTDFDTPFIIVKGVDDCRYLDERAEAFCRRVLR